MLLCVRNIARDEDTGYAIIDDDRQLARCVPRRGYKMHAVCQRMAARERADCTMSDLNFHAQVWDLSGNRRLAASLRTLMVPYFAYGSVYNMSRPDLTEELLERQHCTYVDFLRGRGSLTADECVRFHLGGS